MVLRVGDHDELQAAVLAFKAANRNLRKEINKRTRDEMNPVWRALVDDHLSGRDHFTRRMLANGVRIAAGNPPTAKAAQSRRKVGSSKRLTPSMDFYLAEFGVDQGKRTTYTRKNRKGSGSHKVTRHVNRGKPQRIRDGRVVFPAFAEIAPRMTSLWVQTIVRTYHDASEGKVT